MFCLFVFVCFLGCRGHRGCLVLGSASVAFCCYDKTRGLAVIYRRTFMLVYASKGLKSVIMGEEWPLQQEAERSQPQPPRADSRDHTGSEAKL